MRDDWSGGAAWDAGAREAFEARLARARPESRPHHLVRKGAALLAAGRSADGVALLERVLTDHPDSLEAASCAERLADHSLAQGDPAEAERQYRRSLALRPDQNGTSGQVHIGLAEALTAQGRHEEALQALDREPAGGLTLHSAVSRWEAALALAAAGAGRRDEAREAARRALALLDAPDQFPRHPGVGRARLDPEQQALLRELAAEGTGRRRRARWWPLRR